MVLSHGLQPPDNILTREEPHQTLLIEVLLWTLEPLSQDPNLGS